MYLLIGVNYEHCCTFSCVTDHKPKDTEEAVSILAREKIVSSSSIDEVLVVSKGLYVDQYVGA
jgi:hypothetical protein